MNKRLFIIALLVCAAILTPYLWNKAMPGKRYITVNADESITDATRYVESGEYAYNCHQMKLIRRIPLAFPKEEALRLGMENGGGFGEEAEKLAGMLAGKTYWYDSLHYTYTTILEESAIIFSHFFDAMTTFEGKQYIVNVQYVIWRKPHSFSLSVAPYYPKDDIPYEQRLQEAEATCPD